MASGERLTENGVTQRQLERLVELLGAYSSIVLTGRLLDEATGGELTPRAI